MSYSARANSPRGFAVGDLATGMRVAVVHEWLSTLGGSERVLHNILSLYPQAELVCTTPAAGTEEVWLVSAANASGDYTTSQASQTLDFVWSRPKLADPTLSNCAALHRLGSHRRQCPHELG
jgi:hypothetical protein